MYEGNDIIQKITVKYLISYTSTNKCFFASLLTAMKKQPCEQTPTMGVTIDDGQLYLLYNQKWVDTMIEKEGIDGLKGVLEHELLHIVYDHLTKIKMFNRVPEIYNMACIPEGELIVTPNGYSKIEDIPLDTKLYSLTGETPVIKTMKYPYSGDLYKLYFHNCLPILVTPNHPILVSKECRTKGNLLKSYNESMYVKAEDLIAKEKYKGYHFGVVPIVKENKDIFLNLSKYYLNTKDGLRNKMQRKITQSILLDEELSWIMGFYVAEGSKTNKNNEGIAFANKDLNKLYKVQAYFNQFGYKSYYKKDNNVHTLMVNSTAMSKAFEEWFSKGSHFKKIPYFIFQSSPSIAGAFIKGMMAGDGHQNKKGNNIYWSTSKTLVTQLQLLLTKYNILGAIRETYNDPKYGVFSKTKSKVYSVYWNYSPEKTIRKLNGNTVTSFQHRWKVQKNNILTPLLKIEKIKYTGNVYNFETQEHNYLYNNVVTHNSDMSINQLIDKSILPKAVWIPQPDNKPPVKGSLLFPHLYKLPEKKDSEYYYNELMKNAKKIKMNMSGSGNGKDGQDDKDGQGTTLDDHKLWEKMKGSAQMNKEVIKKAVKEAYEYSKKLKGDISYDIEQQVKSMLKPPTISWRQLLKRYIGASIKTGFKSSWKRPNRRFPNSEELKGKVSNRTIRMLLAVDTSGSVSDKDFVDFMVEMKGILNVYKCTIDVLQCDAELHGLSHLYPYSQLNIKFKGRGGTEFKPVFKYLEKHMEYDLLIYFTDLYCGYEGCKSNRPVIWVCTKNGDMHNKPPFGRVVQITKEGQNQGDDEDSGN